MHTIAELPEFRRNAASLLSAASFERLINHLTKHPGAGVLIPGTGGIRKLRWAREGMGKSGGVRVIYYVHDERIPLYLRTVFGKNQKDTLSKAEANEPSELVTLLVKTAGI